MSKVRVCLSILGLTATGLLSNSITKKATAKTIEPPTSNQNWNAKLRYRQTARSPQLSQSLIALNTQNKPINRTFNSVYDISQRRSHPQPLKISYRAADLSLQTAQNIPVSAAENLPVVPPDSQYQQPVDNTGIQPQENSPIVPPENQYQQPEYNSPSTPPESQYQQPEYNSPTVPPENQYQQPVDSQDSNHYDQNYPESQYQYKQQKFQVKPIGNYSVRSAKNLRVIPIIGNEKFAGITAHQEEIEWHSEVVEKFAVEEISDQPKNGHKWSVTPEISTLGAGFSVKKKLNSRMDARVGVHMGSLGLGEYKNDQGHDDHEKDHEHVGYDSDLSLFNISTLMDYRPFKNSGFHVTSGIVFNNNHVNSDANLKHGDDDYFTYNGNYYSHDDITAVKGKVSFPNKIAPYIGIGWNKPVKYGQRWGYSMNLGVMFPGAPNVELTPEIGNEGLRDQILADMKAEEKSIEDDLKGFSVYPVLSMGVSYHF